MPRYCFLVVATALLIAKAIFSQQPPVINSPYDTTWTSLQKYTVPLWYQDAKFGIYHHWGIYAVAGHGTEWYGRRMYPAFEPYRRYLGAWLKINGEGVYATRTANIYGTGPLRFTRNKANNVIYVFDTLWPGNNAQLSIANYNSSNLSKSDIAKITLLGGDGSPLSWSQNATALNITMPAAWFYRVQAYNSAGAMVILYSLNGNVILKRNVAVKRGPNTFAWEKPAGGASSVCILKISSLEGMNFLRDR